LGWSRGWTAEDMDKNVMQFKKSEYILRTSKELVDNCVEILTQIKNINMSNIHAPKPTRDDSLSAAIENSDMNI
jgi:hypothetical protein